jgi:hypothetical protein
MDICHQIYKFFGRKILFKEKLKLKGKENYIHSRYMKSSLSNENIV